MILGNRAIGRYELSKYLNLSEAKTRALLNILIDRELAYTRGKSSGKAGTSLSDLGIKLFRSLNKIFGLHFDPKFLSAYTDLIPVGTHPVILSFKTEINSVTGLYERDLAVRNGAFGAITIVKNKENWQFPDGFDFENSILNKTILSDEFNCCVIVFADTMGNSSNGAIHIVEYHLYDSIFQVIKKFL
jgi:hypothetical protein